MTANHDRKMTLRAAPILARILPAVAAIYSVILILGAYHLGFTIDTTPLEVAIFITGAASVWLAVKEHVLNWPVGIVNVVLWLVYFMHERLFANATLQIVYIVTGFIGWYWWLRGGDKKTPIPIRKASASFTLMVAALVLALSYPAMLFLNRVGGGDTFWDGLTTLLSLAGQYFLMRKWLENWGFWIVADAIYVGGFIAQKHYLNAQLYVIFLVMCFFGIAAWKRVLNAEPTPCTTPS